VTNCAFIFLTEQCNYRCRHCYVSAGPENLFHMSMEVFRKTLDLLRRIGIDDIRLTGGEPTVHPEFFEVVRQAQSTGLRVGIISNGTGLQRSLWTHEFQASLDRCWISLYGLTAQEHAHVSRRSNGEREFHRTTETVGAMSRLHPNLGLGVSLLPGSSRHVKPFLRDVSALGVRRVRILPIQHDGRAQKEYEYVTDFGKEVQELATVIPSWPEVRDFESISINDMFGIDEHTGVSMESCLLRRRRMPAITPSGDVFRCCYNAYISDALVGNIDDMESCVTALQAVVVPGHCRAFNKRGLSPINRCPISKLSIVP
jgi:MoaA/NifB/PqqE/SkfB family radical SAM enzyme